MCVLCVVCCVLCVVWLCVCVYVCFSENKDFKDKNFLFSGEVQPLRMPGKDASGHGRAPRGKCHLLNLQTGVGLALKKKKKSRDSLCACTFRQRRFTQFPIRRLRENTSTSGQTSALGIYTVGGCPVAGDGWAF